MYLNFLLSFDLLFFHLFSLKLASQSSCLPKIEWEKLFGFFSQLFFHYNEPRVRMKIVKINLHVFNSLRCCKRYYKVPIIIIVLLLYL